MPRGRSSPRPDHPRDCRRRRLRCRDRGRARHRYRQASDAGSRGADHRGDAAREAIYLAQTPQAFRRAVLRRRGRARPRGRRRDRRSRARRARRPSGPGRGRRSGEREDHDAGRSRSRACSRPAIRRPIGDACRHRLRPSSARRGPAADPWRRDNPVRLWARSATRMRMRRATPSPTRCSARRRSATSAGTFQTTIRSGRARRASICCAARRRLTARRGVRHPQPRRGRHPRAAAYRAVHRSHSPGPGRRRVRSTLRW